MRGTAPRDFLTDRLVIIVKIVLCTLNAKYIHSSLALYNLRACLPPGIGEVALREYTINTPLLEVLGDLRQERAEVIGLACYVWNIERTMALARLVKKVAPRTVTVLGGPEVTYRAAQLLAADDAVDYVVQGEGEAVLAALTAQLAAGGDAAGIPGVARRRPDGSCDLQGGPQMVAELAKIPFPYAAADMPALRQRIIYYESSRGCPFSCSYCLSSATRGVRFLPPARVRRDLAWFIAQRVRQVKFVDRTFNCRREHYQPIWRYLAQQRDCVTNFHFELAGDLLDEEDLRLLAAVPPGRFQFEIGVQSTNPATLRAINRVSDWPRLAAAVSGLRQAGNIHLHLDLIAGLPEEDLASFRRSFNDVYALQPHMLQLGFLKLLPGAALRRQQVENGYIATDFAPYEVLASRWLSYDDMVRLKMLALVLDVYYNRGHYGHTLAYLLAAAFATPFDLYLALGDFWYQRGWQRVAHGEADLAAKLDAFAGTLPGVEQEVVREVLKFDALLVPNGPRPAFLPWREWRGAAALFRSGGAVRYAPGFRFTSWREAKRDYHVEEFACDLAGWLAAPQRPLRRGRQIVLFDYTRRPTAWRVINAEEGEERG